MIEEEVYFLAYLLHQYAMRRKRDLLGIFLNKFYGMLRINTQSLQFHKKILAYGNMQNIAKSCTWKPLFVKKLGGLRKSLNDRVGMGLVQSI